ncbi:MAG TPA: hypothetical protein DC058_24640 [Planctomycetaceae bacterium]|nr:hypothetical protein [Planctomycetaceae bacterium]
MVQFSGEISGEQCEAQQGQEDGTVDQEGVCDFSAGGQQHEGDGGLEHDGAAAKEKGGLQGPPGGDRECQQQHRVAQKCVSGRAICRCGGQQQSREAGVQQKGERRCRAECQCGEPVRAAVGGLWAVVGRLQGLGNGKRVVGTIWHTGEAALVRFRGQIRGDFRKCFEFSGVLPKISAEIGTDFSGSGGFPM